MTLKIPRFRVRLLRAHHHACASTTNDFGRCFVRATRANRNSGDAEFLDQIASQSASDFTAPSHSAKAMGHKRV